MPPSKIATQEEHLLGDDESQQSLMDCLFDILADDGQPRLPRGLARDRALVQMAEQWCDEADLYPQLLNDTTFVYRMAAALIAVPEDSLQLRITRLLAHSAFFSVRHIFYRAEPRLDQSLKPVWPWPARHSRRAANWQRTRAQTTRQHMRCGRIDWE